MEFFSAVSVDTALFPVTLIAPCPVVDSPSTASVRQVLRPGALKTWSGRESVHSPAEPSSRHSTASYSQPLERVSSSSSSLLNTAFRLSVCLSGRQQQTL
ncbi:unnamed protein product [Lota lota]